MKAKGKEKGVDSEGPKVPTDTLYQLSESMRQETREIAATGLFATVYDNININFCNPEEIIGRHGEQQFLSCPEYSINLRVRHTRKWYLCYTCAAIRCKDWGLECQGPSIVISQCPGVIHYRYCSHKRRKEGLQVSFDIYYPPDSCEAWWPGI